MIVNEPWTQNLDCNHMIITLCQFYIINDQICNISFKDINFHFDIIILFDIVKSHFDITLCTKILCRRHLVSIKWLKQQFVSEQTLISHRDCWQYD